MANTLRFKRGLVSGIPTAALGEPLFTTDTFDLYIGNGTGNTRFQKYIASGTTSQLLRGDGSLLTMPIVLTSPSNGQVLKYNGTSWVNDSDAGITGSGANGQVAYFTGATTQSGSNNLFWDSANARLGIGTNAPVGTLEVNGLSFVNNTGSTTARLLLRNTTTGASSGGLDIREIGVDASFNNASNGYMSFSTNNSERARISPIGNLLLNSTSDNGLRLQVTGDGYFSGSVGIGTSSLTGRSLSVSKNITGQYIFSGGSYGVGVLVDGVIQSDEVGGAAYFRSFAQTQATAFTAGAVYHFEAVQGTFGAGSTVSNQVGFFARESLIGATNNYGFYGNIASGTGRWNLYMNGTANNYMAGSLGIGSASFLSNNSLRVAKNITGSNQSYGVSSSGQIQSDVTVQGHYFITSANTQATAFTLSNLYHYSSTQGTFGASSAVSNQYGFFVDSTLVGATNNYGFFGNIASGTGRWNIYMSGTAANYLNGNTLIGTTTDAGFRLDVNGTMRVSSANNTTGLTVSVGSNASYNFAANSTSGYSATFNINDTALYIGHNSSNRDLRLQTNSTDRLNVKGSGQVRFVPLAAAPTTNVEAGDVYYDSTTNKLRCYNGTTWNDLF